MFDLYNFLNGIKTKKYKQFISIGYNCENAYRFFKKYHFVQSSLFTWTNTICIDNLLNALSDINMIFSSEPKKVPYMWEDTSTDILFHGTEPWEMSVECDKFPNEEYKPYAEELVSRINHLKDKFKEQLTNDKKTLITYTYKTNGENSEQIKENILKLKEALENNGANNCELLVILEEKDKLEVDIPDVFVRYVKEFAPHDNVTIKHYDKKSWNRILGEFRADFKLKKAKKFKFEVMTENK